MYKLEELKQEEMIVEIFKTNVEKKSDGDYILAVMKNRFPNYKINFDLEDCDKILRIEGFDLQYDNVMSHVAGLGYTCVRLE
ncbi:hypothetical protein BSF41_12100 [Flavobacterium sp. ACN2]|uniref:hypothetical protein n=1 Tax=Flavobacterium sp. ACN2 TaxID=1975676 RepID=UPI000BB332B6|nr:hypothetical protein [Flavobacterium sp. ACN2]PBI91608.1 hypothetical protein BSF41_12100 [Flavobacterium sp. ACN2]